MASSTNAVRRISVSLAAILAVSPAPAVAQSIAVQLRNLDGSAPVAGVVVTLVDTGGTTAEERLSDARGQALLSAKAAGMYRIRVSRIGLPQYTSEPVLLAKFERKDVPLWLPSSPAPGRPTTALNDGSRCYMGDRGQAGADLWSATMLAFRASELSASATNRRTTVRSWSRWVPADGARFTRDTVFAEEAAMPFAGIDPADLSANGWIQPNDRGETTYYWPDARLLLSGEFAAAHCFALVLGQSARSGLAGIRFVTARGRRLPDIEGIAWVDAEKAELRVLEFRYVNVRLPWGHSGGQVEFGRLPSGRWAVTRWSMQAPVFEEYESMSQGAQGPAATRRARLLGRNEFGGTVSVTVDAPTRVDAPAPRAVPPTRPDPPTRVDLGRASLNGFVLDSAASQPLREVQVSVFGERLRASTDDRGAFYFEDVPAGTVDLEFLVTSPSGAVVREQRRVTIERKTSMTIVVRIPMQH